MTEPSSTRDNDEPWTIDISIGIGDRHAGSDRDREHHSRRRHRCGGGLVQPERVPSVVSELIDIVFARHQALSKLTDKRCRDSPP